MTHSPNTPRSTFSIPSPSPSSRSDSSAPIPGQARIAQAARCTRPTDHPRRTTTTPPPDVSFHQASAGFELGHADLAPALRRRGRGESQQGLADRAAGLEPGPRRAGRRRLPLRLAAGRTRRVDRDGRRLRAGPELAGEGGVDAALARCQRRLRRASSANSGPAAGSPGSSPTAPGASRSGTSCCAPRPRRSRPGPATPDRERQHLSRLSMGTADRWPWRRNLLKCRANGPRASGPPTMEIADRAHGDVARARLREPRRARLSARSRHLRHQLEGGAGARRLLSSSRDRHLPEIRPRGDHPTGRAAGQPRPTTGRRQDRLQHGQQHVRGLQLRPERRADGRGCGDLPEGPADPDGASGPGLRDARRPQGPPDPDLAGRAHDLLGMAEGGLRLHRRPDPPLHLQPGAVPGRPERDPAGLPDLRAVRGRARGRLHAQGLPARRCRLRHLLDHDRDQLEAGQGPSGPGATLRQRLDRRLVQLPVRRSSARQRADQGRQSRHDRRPDRVFDRQAQGVRHRRFARSAHARDRRHDRPALAELLQVRGRCRPLSEGPRSRQGLHIAVREPEGRHGPQAEASPGRGWAA